MSVFRTALGSAIEGFAKLSFGGRITYLADLVQVFGPRDFFRYTTQIQRITDHLESHYGPIHTQVLLSGAAIWNGCPFCSVGHMYAANLLFFEESNALLPLREDSIPGLCERTDDEALAELQKGLAPLQGVAGALRLQLSVARDEVNDTSEQERLLMRASLAAWAWLTECSVGADISDIPPLHPRVGRDRGLRIRYREARGSDT